MRTVYLHDHKSSLLLLDDKEVLNLYWPYPSTLTNDRELKQVSNHSLFINTSWYVARLLMAATSMPVMFIGFLILMMSGVEPYPWYLLYILLYCLFLFAGALLAEFAIGSNLSAEKLMKLDQRPPILLLRKFTDDHKIVETNFSIMDQTKTFEYMLTKKLSSYGPVVAIRNPDNQIGLHGPSLLEANVGTWQEDVTTLIKCAGAIVMFANTSVGLLWELNEIADYKMLYKTVLIIPPHVKQTREQIYPPGSYTMELIDNLYRRPEFKEFRNIDVRETLLIRWSVNGELIIFKAPFKSFYSILAALDRCINMSSCKLS